MKITVLMDSFKGSLSSTEAGEAVKSGITESGTDTDVSVYPFADGGEGTLDAFLAADKGSKRITIPVSDPLGRKIYDRDHEEVDDGAKGLSQADSIDTTSLLPELTKCEVLIACDVENPLCGPNGASCVFAPQKGAKPEDVLKMDKWMLGFSDIVKDHFPTADRNAPGAGAAGGMGFSLVTFLGAKMQPGAEVLLERTDIEKEIAASDLVITGEGRIDGQTAMGKAPARIAKMAKKYNKKVIAIGGCLGEGYEKCYGSGIDAVYPVTPEGMDLEEAMKKEVATENIKRVANLIYEKETE